MKIVFKLLNVDSDLFVTNYNKLYNFTDPIRHDYNLRIDRNYEIDFMQNLEKKIRENGMTFDFPNLKGISYNKNLKFKNVDKNQLTLTNYV